LNIFQLYLITGNGTLAKLTDDEIKTFQTNFHYLTQKAFAYLIDKEWADKIDKQVRVNIVTINDREITFELIHVMVNRLEATKTFTWSEINELN